MDQSDRLAKIVARGVLRGHEAGGEVVLETTALGSVLRLKEYWIAQGAPDVRIYLTPDKAGNVEIDGAIDLGKVTTFSGRVSAYAIPEGISLRQMGAVVVYCTVYSVTFGVAALDPV